MFDNNWINHVSHKLTLSLALVIVSTVSHAADKVNWEESPIRYSETEPKRNAIARLQVGLDQSSVQLDYSGERGYLKSVLKQLKIPESSQVLVFSKTSLQDDKISPKQPRAIYFNEVAHVGYVRGGVIEIAVPDADLGMAFYTLDPEQVEHPRFIRQANRCLSCHGAARTKGVPGLLVRSVYPNKLGEPVVKAGSYLSNHRSPLSERWGGWYVTGQHGQQQHLGNYWLAEPSKPKSFDNSVGMNRNNLEKWLDTGAYLTGHSDIVALMVLEHQVEAFNLLTHANFVTQHATWECAQLIAAGKDRGEAERVAHERIRNAVRPLALYLLYSQETKLSAPISGPSNFQDEFARASDQTGARTARQFDLETRLFRIRLSYLVYSPVFAEQLPALQAALSDELWAATGDSYKAPKLIDLSVTERQAIRAILESSPPVWFKVSESNANHSLGD